MQQNEKLIKHFLKKVLPGEELPIKLLLGKKKEAESKFQNFSEK